jgi:hypothetical protein
MIRRTLFAALLPLAVLAQGCVTWRAVDVTDHTHENVTVLQLVKHSKFLWYSSAEHVFFACSDKGKELDCQRMCGGGTDFDCPSSFEGHANVR